MHTLRIAALAVVALSGSTIAVGRASAMPMDSLVSATTQVADNVQNVRWVCGPYRCWWGPGPYWGGPYWGPRPYWGWRRWGWHRPWW
jgi:hypothetical protein